jgi:phosphoglycerate dehydrogenase-like enzyme
VADVLVLEGVDGPAIDRLGDAFGLERAATLDEARRLDDVRALIVRNRTRVDAAALAALPAVRVVARAGAGLDNVDVAAAQAAGVTVTYAPGANAGGTAEHTLALALAVAHRVCELDREVRAGGWERRAPSELAGDAWGVVGVGRIGSRVAALARGIGMDVLGYDPALAPDDLRRAGVRPVGLLELAARARVVSLHVPLTIATRGLAGAGLFARMRDDAILVNTARGELVDRPRWRTRCRQGARPGPGSTSARPSPRTPRTRSRTSPRSS